MSKPFIFEPLNVFTGGQGAGKTLFAIEQADLLANEKGSEAKIYQVKIRKPDTRYLPHLPFKVSDMRYHDDGSPVLDEAGNHLPMWTTLPVGSVVIVDEAHLTFPQRGPGRPPRFVEAMAEARYEGIRWLLLTQAPGSLDSFLRERVNQHFHLERKGGLRSCTFYQFENRVVSKEAIPMQKKYADRKFRRRFPKKYYGWYESAKHHFFRFSLPLKIWFALAMIPVLGFAGFRVIDTVGGVVGGSSSALAAGGQGELGEGSPLALSSSAEAVGGGEQFQLANAYLKQFLPLVPTMPVSAPAYEGIPIRAEPRLFCVGSGVDFSGGCRCYTEQATPYPIPLEAATCERIAKHGIYEPHRSPIGSGVEAERSPSDAAGVSEPSSVRAPEPASLAPVGLSNPAGVASYGGFRP